MDPPDQRQQLTKLCICLSGLPKDIKPETLCQQFPGARTAAPVPTPNDEEIYKWLILFHSPDAARYFSNQRVYNLTIENKKYEAKLDQVIPCDIPEEWLQLDINTQQGTPYPNYPYPGNAPPYNTQSPGGPQQYPTGGHRNTQSPGGPQQYPPGGPQQYPHAAPQWYQGQQGGPFEYPSGTSSPDHQTAPKEQGPPGSGPGYGPGFGPGQGYGPNPQHGHFPPGAGPMNPEQLRYFMEQQQHWMAYYQQFGGQQYPGAPPPYSSQRADGTNPRTDQGPGYSSPLIAQVQDEELEKLRRKGKKEEKRQSYEPKEDKRQSKEPKETNMIKVSKLPAGTTKDALTFFFENRRKSGGGETEDVDFDTSDMTAIITFEDKEAVKRVLQKLPMLFQDKQIQVDEFYPGGGVGDGSDDSDDGEADEEEESEPHCIIEVKGFKPKSTDDTIQLYFENKKRSGGGDIEKFEREEEVIYITFESEEVVDRVVNQKHKVDGVALQVKQYIPPPPPKPRPVYDDKVYIQGMNPETTQDCLMNFLEAKTGGVSASQILYGEEDGTALVTFEEVPDFEKLQNACKRRQLEGCYLTIAKVPITNCILVTGFKENTSQDTLEFYFENKKRSGGGEIEKIQFNKEDNSCLVFFEDHTVLDEVCRKDHAIDSQKLKVRVYHECLGQIDEDDEKEMGPSQGATGGVKGSGRKFKQPEPFVIDGAEQKKLEFLKHSKVVKDALEKQMESCHGKIQWQKQKTDPVVIHCALTPDVKDCKNLAKTWKKTATENFNKFLGALIVEEHTALQEAWGQVMEGLQSMTISHPDGVAVMTEQENCKIIIVGYKRIVDGVSKQVKEIITKVGEELDRKKKQVIEKVKVKYHQIRLLMISHFPENISKKLEGVKVKADMKTFELTFEGLSSEVNAAKLDMYQIFNQIVSSKVGQFSQEKIDFCDSKKVREYLVGKLKSKHLVAVWQIENGRNVLMYALSDKEAVDASHIFQKSIVETPIDLKQDSVYLLQGDAWAKKKQEVEDFSTGLVKVVELPKELKIMIFTTTECSGECREFVDDFFTFNTVYEKVLKLSPGEMNFLKKHHDRDINAIAKGLKADQVTITIDDASIKIKGTSQGLNKAMQGVDDIVQKIVKKQHTFSKPGMAKYMTSDEGQNKIRNVEKVKKCYIDSSDSGDSDPDAFEIVDNPASSSKHQEFAVCMTRGGRRITVVKGDLTDLDTDVIINAANKELKHVGGLAKAIVKKGGYSIQKECTDHVSRKEALLEGDVFCSGSGTLKCQMIVHAVGPVWQSGNNNEEELLREVIFKSMEECSKKGLRSIGIPAICCGVFGFPVKLATQAIAEAAKDFFKENDNSTIKDIYLCDINDSTIQLFIEGLKKVFGAKSVQEKGAKGGSRWKDAGHNRGGRHTSYSSAGDDDDDDDDYGSGVGSAGASCKIKIRIIKGQISQQTVDVIVNTTSKDLNLSNGAVSASLLKAAGPTLQQECSQQYPSGINYGDVAVTSAGNLRCQLVFHGSLPSWNAGTSPGILQKFINNCLREADKKGFSTIAFPALGTGNLGFPKDLVAKEMFSCVGDFSSKNPSSSVTKVYFVLYDKDFATVKAFEDFDKKWHRGGGGGGGGAGGGGGKGVGRKGRHFGSGHEAVEAEFHGSGGHKHYGGSYDKDEGNKPGKGQQKQRKDNSDLSSIQIGSLRVKIYQGDITSTKANAIVNSTNGDLDLSKGAVSKAISDKGGKALSNELKLKVPDMKKDGIVVTSSGTGLPCEYIIHLNAEDSRGWKSRIHKSLKEAEKLQLKTLAFPALGTGQGVKVSDIADYFYEAVLEYENSCKYLQEVHMVIFQRAMVKDFCTAFKQCIDTKPKSKGIFAKVGEWFWGSVDEDDDVKPKENKHGKHHNKQTHASKAKAGPQTFTIVVYADSHKTIRDAIKMLEDQVEKEFMDREFSDKTIKEFSNAQKRAVYALREKNVDVSFDEKSGYIKITGITTDLLDASDVIHQLIRDAQRNRQAGQEAELISDMVQWHCIEVTSKGQELTPYPKNVNRIIERAYRDSKPTATFRDNKQKEYTVDFSALKEYPTDNPTDTVQVIRREVKRDTTFEIPSNWSTMQDSENMTVIVLPSTDTEHQTVVNSFKQTSGGNYTIVKVERIQNRTLYQQYVAKKQSMDGQNKQGHQNERTLWHGTAGTAKDSINMYGFNRSYCGKNATVHGEGVYFAINANYSCRPTYSPPDGSGNKYIYQSKVLTGEFTQGSQGMRVPPVKQTGHILYDSVTDNPNHPGMFVIFNDTQAYPEYLITFK